MIAACSKITIDEPQGNNAIIDEAPETLVVGFEDDETRIQLNEDKKSVWTKGDCVSVFYRSDANQQWQYTGDGDVIKGVRLRGNACEQVAGLVYINSSTPKREWLTIAVSHTLLLVVLLLNIEV